MGKFHSVGPRIEEALDLPVRRDEHGMPADYSPDELAFMGQGACNTKDPDLFVTDTNHGKTSMRGTVVIGGVRISKKEQIEAARNVCRSCTVLEECAAFVKRYPEPEGVWAATIPEERRTGHGT